MKKLIPFDKGVNLKRAYLSTPKPGFKIGDKVKAFNSGHISTIKKKSGEHWVLTEKDPRHCCNYYFESELKLVK